MPKSYSLLRIFGNSLVCLIVWSGVLVGLEEMRPNSTLANRLAHQRSLQSYLLQTLLEE